MHGKRSYPGVLAAAAAAAFSLQAGVSTAAEAPAVADSDQTADAAISARVKAALAADNQLLTRHIDVSVRQGVVHLGGFAESEQDLRLAELDAKSVPGVSKVDNEIELKTRPDKGPH